MNLLPDSIRTRTVLTLLVGLTASHLASTVFYSIGSMGTGAWSPGSLASTLVMAVAILAFAWWASGWITAPMSDFARASERLGMDVNAPALAEDGPEEVRAAARAFNQMQTRIRSFIEDRLRMLAAISHDLRGPITRLRLRIEQIDIDTSAQVKMLADLDEMAQMVDSSLAFARDEATDEASQPVDLAALLNTLCDEAVDSGRKAEFDWEGRLVFHGRPLAMKRLFANIIDNALRYGEVVVVRASSDQKMVQVMIDDEGPGIPDGEIENVFKPFFRLERSRNKRTGGIGLGLATARTIARAHGGDIILQNRPGGGLRATVTLVNRTEPDGMVAEPHILIVDDDSEICVLVRQFLEPHGFRVTAASDGQSMRAALAADKADLVILDLMLPGEDGLSLCRELRVKSKTPIIFLTAINTEADRVAGLELGADDYLSKPFSTRELLARVRAVLRRAAPAPNETSAEMPAIASGPRLRFSGWTLDTSRRQLTSPEDVLVDLSGGEYELLVAFLERPRIVLNRDKLLDITRGRFSGPFDRAIDMQVGRLRRKIEADPKNPALIKTVRGGGYVLASPVETY